MHSAVISTKIYHPSPVHRYYQGTMMMQLGSNSITSRAETCREKAASLKLQQNPYNTLTLFSINMSTESDMSVVLRPPPYLLTAVLTMISYHSNLCVAAGKRHTADSTR